MTPFDQTVAHITQLPTMLYGLSFFPSLEPHCSNDQDYPNWGWPVDAPEVSDCNIETVRVVLSRLGNNCNSIMEIGVHRNDGRSMSNILMDQKPSGCKYLGVDLDDKSYLDDQSKMVHTIKANSHDKVTVRSRLRQLGIESIDLLMIDGWHSVHTSVNDWGYVDLLSDHGVVILHDTNAHPGCVALFHAVDESCFDKQRFCIDSNDMGISVFWHKRRS